MQRVNRRSNRRRSGFTLLEVLLVVVILGMLAALVVPNLMGTQAETQKKLAKQMVEEGGAIGMQLTLYKMNVGSYPEKLEDLTKVPDDEETRRKYGNNGEPYIKDASKLKDPYGNDLQYKYPGDINKEGYDLYSMGPDGKEGGDDDIGNWTTDR